MEDFEGTTFLFGRMVMDAIADYVFVILKAMGGGLALIAVVVLFVGAVRSIFSVTVGRAILVLPFKGSEVLGVWVSGLLSQELELVEKQWWDLKNRINEELKQGTQTSSAQLLDLGRGRGDQLASLKKDQIIAPSPGDSQAIGEISVGGIRRGVGAFRAGIGRKRVPCVWP